MTSRVYFNWEIQQLLTDIAYVDLGLVPPSHYPRSSQSSLQLSLQQLDPADSRKAKRKFRKILKKAWKGKRDPPSYDARQNCVKWYIIEHYVSANPVDNDD